jgi:hypothetical protein
LGSDFGIPVVGLAAVDLTGFSPEAVALDQSAFYQAFRDCFGVVQTMSVGSCGGQTVCFSGGTAMLHWGAALQYPVKADVRAVSMISSSYPPLGVNNYVSWDRGSLSK